MSSFTYGQSPEIDSLLDDLHYSINSQHPGPHPWLSDLTSLALMLEGQLELPHGKEVKTTSMRFGQIVVNNVAVQPFFDSNCHECIKAYDRQQEYKSQKASFRRTVIMTTEPYTNDENYVQELDPIYDHLWSHDLTIYAKMIAGEYSLPHIKVIRGNITGKLTEVIDCNECRNALKQQERYQQEQSNHEL